MTNRPNLLVIAPYAPPKNAAEPIQVRRILAELDKHASGRLVTLPPDKSAWVPHDDSLELKLNHFDTHYLKLPAHALTHRIITSHLLSKYHVPDATRWITWLSDNILEKLTKDPDVIYSRSYPMSSALLARSLKHELGVPWIMHLSDPWADNPYAAQQSVAPQQEADAFADADLITLTTEKQAQHYRKKYPNYAAKIPVTPNVMPEPHPSVQATGDSLKIVLAGNLYGQRSPEPLLAALSMLQPAERKKIRVDIYGNVAPELLPQLNTAPDVLRYHGPVSYEKAYHAQQSADVIMSIEPSLDHPLSNAFMPSKVLEAVALGKPLLAITPKDSETDMLCRDGFGYAAQTPDQLAEHLRQLLGNLSALRSAEPKAPPVRYTAQHAVDELLQHIARLT